MFAYVGHIRFKYKFMDMFLYMETKYFIRNYYITCISSENCYKSEAFTAGQDS